MGHQAFTLNLNGIRFKFTEIILTCKPKSEVVYAVVSSVAKMAFFGYYALLDEANSVLFKLYNARSLASLFANELRIVL